VLTIIRQAARAYKILLILVIFLGLELLSQPQMAAARERPYIPEPTTVIELRQGQQTGQPLKLQGARNEFLSWQFTIAGADSASLRITTPGAKVAYRFYQVISAPLSAPPGYPADALIPLEQGLRPGRALQIWVTIKIPAGLAKGVYPQELVFQDRNGGYRQPIDLKVWNFVLPEDLPITIMGNLWGDRELFARYGVKTEAQFDEVLKAYLRSMREYKFNALGPKLYPLSTNQLGAREVETVPGYNGILGHALNTLNYRYFCLPMVKLNKDSLEAEKSRFLQETGSYYPAFLKYLRSRHWENRAINKVMDEPRHPYYPAVYDVYAQSKKLAPGVKTFCTGQGIDLRLAKAINFWALTPKFFNPDQMAAAKAQGQEIWFYANRFHSLKQPRAVPRLIGWILYRYNFSGYYFWGLNYWKQDPWTTESGKIDRWRRGMFYYPQPGTGAPVATTRLEALRRGFQDYQYLVLLKQARARDKVPAGGYEEVQRRVAHLTRDFHPWMPEGFSRVSMTELEELRSRIGEMLDKAF